MTAPRLSLSALPKAWIIDLDGVVFRHNGYLDGDDEVLDGAARFWAQVAPDDVVVVMTGRSEDERSRTLSLLAAHGLRVDYALFGLPTGERVLINDTKTSGLLTAYAVNLPRDQGLGDIAVSIDETLLFPGQDCDLRCRDWG